MVQTTDDHDLVRSATCGDRPALERLLLRHFDRLLAHISSRFPPALRSRMAAEDVLQETFVHAIRDASGCLAQSPEAFVGWLTRIADNRLIDALRRERSAKRAGNAAGFASSGSSGEAWRDLAEALLDQSLTPARSAARDEAVNALRERIALLPLEQRQALHHHLLQQKTLEETAASMGRTPDGVRGLVHRAKLALRESMGQSSIWLIR